MIQIPQQPELKETLILPEGWMDAFTLDRDQPLLQAKRIVAAIDNFAAEWWRKQEPANCVTVPQQHDLFKMAKEADARGLDNYTVDQVAAPRRIIDMDHDCKFDPLPKTIFKHVVSCLLDLKVHYSNAGFWFVTLPTCYLRREAYNVELFLWNHTFHWKPTAKQVAEWKPPAIRQVLMSSHSASAAPTPTAQPTTASSATK
jgi:hypothetical protein